MVSKDNVLDEMGHLLVDLPSVETAFIEAAPGMGLKHIYTNTVDSIAFIPAEPSLYTRETRFVFRDMTNSSLMVWVLYEVFNDPSKKGLPISKEAVFFEQRWKVTVWLPVQRGETSGDGSRQEAMDHSIFHREEFNPGSGGVFVEDETLRLFYEFWKRAETVSVSAVLDMTRYYLELSRTLALPKFGTTNITGLAPRKWNQRAKEVFWVKFPLEELKGLATLMHGDDMPFSLRE